MPKPSFIGFSPLSRLPARFGPSAFLIGSVRRLRLFPSCVLSFDLCRWSNCGSKAVLHTRRRLVYAAEVVGDYGTILTRLANGHDIHRGALLEKPLAEPLPRESVWPGAAATIRRFEPNLVWVEVEAKEKALLVLAEAWYPGWRAEIDGRAGECLPANIWMRAIPVPAGRHQVRFYFHQNYLLPGLLLSLASTGLLLLVRARPRRRTS